MNTSFNRFHYMYRHNELNDDVTWRGYDIPTRACERRSYAAKALRKLGLSYAGEHALSQFMALYEVRDPKLATWLLACWFLWSEVARGRRPKGLRERAVEGAGAATLPAGPPAPP